MAYRWVTVCQQNLELMLKDISVQLNSFFKRNFLVASASHFLELICRLLHKRRLVTRIVIRFRLLPTPFFAKLQLTMQRALLPPHSTKISLFHPFNWINLIHLNLIRINFTSIDSSSKALQTFLWLQIYRSSGLAEIILRLANVVSAIYWSFCIFWRFEDLNEFGSSCIQKIIDRSLNKLSNCVKLN